MFRLGATQVPGNPQNRFEVLVGTEDYQYQHISSITDIPIGSWTHLATVYDGSNIWLYINGVAPDNVYRNDVITSNGVIQTGTMTMGVSSATISAQSTENFHGKIDDIFLYDRALSSSEIYELYSAPNPVPEPSTFLLVFSGLIGLRLKKRANKFR
jgi:hypothetical protein